ncbi:MAG: CdaR family protein [Vicinamibacterales bacterium]
MARIGGQHIWRKGVALLAAAGLWFIIGGQKVVERAIRVPLEYTNLPSGIEMTGEIPTVVDIRVRGSEAALSRMVPGEMVAVLDLAGARAGNRLFHLTGSDVRSPSGVEVVQVTPGNVAIGFEATVSKIVRVSPAVEGTPAFGYEIGAITSTPPTVEVFGPAGALAALQAVITEPVSVAGASSTVHETVTIGVADRNVRIQTLQRVDVSIEMRPAPAERIVSGVAVEVRGGRATPEPAEAAVTVKGAAQALEGLTATALRVYVDVSAARPGMRKLPVAVDVPAGVSVVRVEPDQVSVRVR